ncbi:DUF2971 domain-containing protein [Leptospira wolffii]|uniref:DUF2971 domain-containing protein n=1 Tax=Leptospira wolffii TaxID=409998 RepID=UPI0010841A5B|nr:DUF2971 domain-containing protein [Leptospira wolffii]TGL55272.1 DUF2971 domain-containing protein [Leptospira wolffii]
MKELDKLIFKYVSGEDYHFDSIRNNYFYFARTNEVNDPEDCKVNPSLDISDTSLEEIENFFIKNAEEKDLSALRKTAKQIYYDEKIRKDFEVNYEKSNQEDDERFIKTFKLLCLTKNYSSLHMWDNYAKKNESLDGFCFGYECQPGKIVNIIREHKTFWVPLKKGYVVVNGQEMEKFIANQVFYGDEEKIPYNPFKSNSDVLTNSYYYKHSKWKEEEEYRILLIDKYTPEKKIQKIKYPESTLKAIIIGENCDSDKLEKLYQAIDFNVGYIDIRFFKAIRTDNLISIEPFERN